MVYVPFLSDSWMASFWLNNTRIQMSVLVVPSQREPRATSNIIPVHFRHLFAPEIEVSWEKTCRIGSQVRGQTSRSNKGLYPAWTDGEPCLGTQESDKGRCSSAHSDSQWLEAPALLLLRHSHTPSRTNMPAGCGYKWRNPELTDH